MMIHSFGCDRRG